MAIEPDDASRFCCNRNGAAGRAGCRLFRAGDAGRAPNVSAIPDIDQGTIVNDIHSQLNATRVAEIVKPTAVDALHAAMRRAADAGRPIAVAGGRHAMGGQQFADDALLVDSRALDRVLAFDEDAGIVTVEGGIQWPALLS